MRERPISFSGPMVRALLDGRKLQTRRIVRPQPVPVSFGWELRGSGGRIAQWGEHIKARCATVLCPHGVPGDRLWVREEHRVIRGGAHRMQVEYVADGWVQECTVSDREVRLFRKRKEPFAQTRARFMYRSFARILLEITGVRIERLQAISPEDALDEGIDHYCSNVTAALRGEAEADPVEEYRELWESLNGPGSWAANSWVWVITFRRVRA